MKKVKRKPKLGMLVAMATLSAVSLALLREKEPRIAKTPTHTMPKDRITVAERATRVPTDSFQFAPTESKPTAGDSLLQ